MVDQKLNELVRLGYANIVISLRKNRKLNLYSEGIYEICSKIIELGKRTPDKDSFTEKITSAINTSQNIDEFANNIGSNNLTTPSTPAATLDPTPTPAPATNLDPITLQENKATMINFGLNEGVVDRLAVLHSNANNVASSVVDVLKKFDYIDGKQNKEEALKEFKAEFETLMDFDADKLNMVLKSATKENKQKLLNVMRDLLKDHASTDEAVVTKMLLYFPRMHSISRLAAIHLLKSNTGDLLDLRDNEITEKLFELINKTVEKINKLPHKSNWGVTTHFGKTPRNYMLFKDRSSKNQRTHKLGYVDFHLGSKRVETVKRAKLAGGSRKRKTKNKKKTRKGFNKKKVKR